MSAFTRIRAAFRPLLLAAALAAAAANPLAAQARVLGRVTDGAGNAVAGASVTVAAADGTERTTTTGPGGGFQFADLPAGTYTLRAERGSAGQARERSITLAAGQVASPVVRLLGGSQRRPSGTRRTPPQQ
ncbi:MAG TPA: carboxypeptidase-like regulatory domain-containing protein [Longimicrobium sp.]|jgi:hypothetical protein|uniref:carboxypeptidase-like regulatory domain-containing protein n=1 Tax=Longimicrobium sp. TaxID=2029185 RepID=UPI002ED86C07